LSGGGGGGEGANEKIVVKEDLDTEVKHGNLLHKEDCDR
jgi:hypothetical protein